ncbi:hypothetical protein J0H58_09030 [bacterium]|nr:hypothetical protein [bacterium]
MSALWERLKLVLPEDLTRFEPGLARLLAGYDAVFATGRDRFTAWRAGWDATWSAHPPQPLTAPETVS